MAKHHVVSEKTRAFLSQEKKLLVGGKWQPAASGKTFACENPANGDQLCQVAHGTEEDTKRAVQAARKAFTDPAWQKMKASDRGKLLFKLAELVESNAEQLAELETLDNGKPYAVAKAADVTLAADLFRYMAGWATKIEGSVIPVSVPYSPNEYFAYTRKEPVGVVAQIIPWNFPLLMAAWKLGPALATSNTLVLKPAEQTPLSALRLAELVCEAGYPDGVLNVVTGFGDAGAALVNNPDVDKVAFTGSTEVGKEIVRQSAQNLKKVTLELGGKSPHVICADANLDVAIPGAAAGIFFNHGQCCCAGSRVFVEKPIYEQVVEQLAKCASDIVVGDGFNEDTGMGPLVSAEQRDRVHGLVQKGVSEGAHCQAGGSHKEGSGYFYQPTVVTNSGQDNTLNREEIFGPVVTVQPFDDYETMIHQANDTTYGLAAGVWTESTKKAQQISSAIRAGTVWVNCYNVFDAAMPFGGYKQSGWGREMGKEVLNLYTETKSVCMDIS